SSSATPTRGSGRTPIRSPSSPPRARSPSATDPWSSIMHTRITTLALVALPAAAIAQPFTITAASISCGGSTTPAAAGPFTLIWVIGDPLARNAGAAGPYSISAGFLAAASGGGPPACYANCDASTIAPILNV